MSNIYNFRRHLKMFEKELHDFHIRSLVENPCSVVHHPRRNLRFIYQRQFRSNYLVISCCVE